MTYEEAVWVVETWPRLTLGLTVQLAFHVRDITNDSDNVLSHGPRDGISDEDLVQKAIDRYFRYEEAHEIYRWGKP